MSEYSDNLIPDQYRREGFRAGIEAAAHQVKSMRATDGVLHKQTQNLIVTALNIAAIRAIDVDEDEVLAGITTAPDAVAGLWHAARLGLDMALANDLTNTADTIMEAMNAVKCPCRGSDEMCPCQNRLHARSAVKAAEIPRAWVDVMGERVRQITVEGWTPEHDDEHAEYEMAKAAGCYAWIAGQSDKLRLIFDATPPTWPSNWDSYWWNPTDRRRDLVKAGALILAEIERLDRAALAQKGGE